MEELALATKQEIPILINYLDPEQKGYVNFKEFHQKIRSNVTQQDENGKATVLPYVVPSKQIHERIVSEIPETKKKVADLMKPYEAVPYDLRSSTRYGSSPQWKNTFLTFQSACNTPQYISENERLSRNPSMNTFFQTEEREKKKVAEVSRVQAKKTHQDFFSKKIQFETEFNELREKTKNYNKNMAQTIYEHKAKLLNCLP